MRLLYVTPFFVPVIGGVETVVYETCSALARRGHRCFVATSPMACCPPKESVAGISVNRLANMDIPASGVVQPDEFRWAQLADEFGDLLAEVQPDVIHYHNFHMEQYALYLFSMLKAIDPRGTPIVMTVHNTTTTPLAHYVLSYLPLSRVFALTNQSAMDLLRGGVPSSRVRVLPNMLDASKFRNADGSSVRRDLGLDDSLVILFPSRIVGREGNAVYGDRDGKGLDVLLRALPLIKRDIGRAKLLLMGNDPIYPETVRRLRREILNIATIFGMEESIVFFEDPIAQEKLPEIYAASDVVVSLGATECFGMVFLEGMAAGKPVVGVNGTMNGVPEVVWGGKAGTLVPPNNPWRTAEAVVEILKDKDRAASMGRNGIRWVESRYDANVVVPKLLDLYGECIGREESAVAPLQA